MSKALVAGVFGAYHHVLPYPLVSRAERFKAKARGKLRIEYRERNEGYKKLRESLLAVGDIVDISEDAKNPDTWIIEAVEKRRNAVHRASFGRQQCLAANIDGVVIMASVRSPEFNLGFVERCLAEVQISGVSVLLIVNKYDLITQPDEETEKVLRWYESISIAVQRETLKDGLSPALRERFASGTWLLLGQSGTGKSTLLNQLFGQSLQAVGEISLINKGRHTTTNPALYCDPENSKLVLIDVPGLREFGMHHRDAQEIRQAYPDFLRYQCRFENCLHLNEPGCAVKAAVEQNEIPEFRYRYYVSMLDTVQENFKPRKGDYWRGIRK